MDTSVKDLVVDFDRRSDVLYVTYGSVHAVEGEAGPFGIEVDFDAESNLPCGITVIGLHEYGWDRRLGDIAQVAGEHLGLAPATVLSAVRTALQ